LLYCDGLIFQNKGQGVHKTVGVNVGICGLVTRILLLSIIGWGGGCAVSDWEFKPGKGKGGHRRIISPGSLAVVGPLENIKPAVEDAKPEQTTEISPLQIDNKQTVVPQRAAEKVLPVILSTPVSKPVPTPAPRSVSTPTPVPVTADQRAIPSKTVPNKKARILTRISGRVRVLGSDDLAESSGVILTLKPVDGRVLGQALFPATRIIDMKNKFYDPGLLSINKNDRLRFVNKDKIKHNVFSSSGESAFDLGTYGPGKKREVSLNAAGIVKVYCNIHSEMATFVVVNENSISTIADELGYYEISGVPPGKYELRVWNIRGETTKIIQVEQNNKRVDIVLDAVNYKQIEHKNKFGKIYNKNASFFDDEFY